MRPESRKYLWDASQAVDRITRFVAGKTFQAAIAEKLARMGRSRLAAECAKLDPKFEKALAEAGLSRELEAWPAY
jgi:hypothetical protein